MKTTFELNTQELEYAIGGGAIAALLACLTQKEAVPGEKASPLPGQIQMPLHQEPVTTSQPEISPVIAETTPPAVQPPASQQTVPVTVPAYTVDQLAVAATQLMDAGKREALLQLLSAFGVQALTMLPKEQYGAFAAKLRELGAKL